MNAAPTAAATSLAAHRTRRRLHACGFATERLGTTLLGARRGDERLVLQCSESDAHFGCLVACYAVAAELPSEIVAALAEETNARPGAYVATFDAERHLLAIRTRAEVDPGSAGRPDFAGADSELARYADAFFCVAYDRARFARPKPC